MSKLFFLFCYIFGCQGTNIIGAFPKTLENGTACTNIGRFPNPLDMECQSYILCLTNENDQYVSDLVECPTETIFNATRGRCGRASPNFVCPHICQDVGKIPYRKIDCQHYILCERDSENGEMTAEFGRCPNGTWFCGEVRKCLPGFADACLSDNSTSSSNWTTEATTTQNPNTTLVANETTVQTTTEEVISGLNTTTIDPWTDSTTNPNSSTTVSDDFHFTCNQIGRFPLSEICNQYILCLQGVNGEWIMSLEKCPKGRVFSRTRLRCVTI